MTTATTAKTAKTAKTASTATTVTETVTETGTVTRNDGQARAGTGNRDRYCPGCPRCRNPETPMCPQNHVKFGGLHPRCKVCGCCVLRGRHRDGAEDLDEMEGPGRHVGLGPISNN